MKKLIQSNIFDPLIPYLTRVSLDTNEVDFILPNELILNKEQIKTYFSEVKISYPRLPGKDHGFGIHSFGPLLNRELNGTLKSKEITKYLYSKMK